MHHVGVQTVQCASCCTSIKKCILAGELWCTAKGWCPSNTSHFTSYHAHSLRVSHIERSPRWSKYFLDAVNTCVISGAFCRNFFAEAPLSRAVQWQFKMQQACMECNLFLFIAFPADFLTIGMHPSPCSKLNFKLVGSWLSWTLNFKLIVFVLSNISFCISKCPLSKV